MTTELQTSPAAFDLLGMDRQIQRRIVRQRAAKVGAWLGLVVVGLKKGGLLGWVATGVGVTALAREWTLWREQRPEWRKAAPPLSTPWRRLLRPLHGDPTDQASANSFPASDAPSHDRH